MADEKPQGEEPLSPEHSPDPTITPPALIIVQEGFSPAREAKVPDQQLKPPSLVSVQCFEPKGPGSITGEDKGSGSGEEK
jgi:hypothetical protein